MGIEIGPPARMRAEVAILQCMICGYSMSIPDGGYRVGETWSFYCPICGRTTLFRVVELKPCIAPCFEGEEFRPMDSILAKVERNIKLLRRLILG